MLLVWVQKGNRPTIPPSTPQGLAELIGHSWDHSPDRRPSAQEILQQLEQLQQEYEENMAKWEEAKLQQL
jgi:hypothetical protein